MLSSSPEYRAAIERVAAMKLDACTKLIIHTHLAVRENIDQFDRDFSSLTFDEIIDKFAT